MDNKVKLYVAVFREKIETTKSHKIHPILRVKGYKHKLVINTDMGLQYVIFSQKPFEELLGVNSLNINDHPKNFGIANFEDDNITLKDVLIGLIEDYDSILLKDTLVEIEYIMLDHLIVL